MNFKSILFFLGVYSSIISFFAFLNILYSIHFNFVLDINSYLYCLVISLSFGIFFISIRDKQISNISLNNQILLIIIGFVFLPLLISIPYYFSSYNISFINSYFESISGFTSTGFSILNNLENINEPLLLWRSSSQWIGGIFFLISIIGTIGTNQIKIKPGYLMQGITSSSNFYNNFVNNFFKISIIYSLSTILILILYNSTGVRLFDSLNLAMTVISSGGFIPSNDISNILYSDFQILILSITLLLPILNFFILFNLFTNQFKLKNHQEDLHIIVIIFILILLFYFIIIPNEEITNVFLAITSSIATSGIGIYSANLDISLFLLLLTIMGGSLISTSSGIKYVRFYILLKVSYQEIYKLAKPINIFDKNFFNTESKIQDDDTKIAFLVFISFIFSLFILSSILTFDNLDFENAFKLSILTLTNTTTSSLYGFENLNFFDLNNFTKLSLITFMILGKIEIVAILFLIRKFIFKE